MLTWSSHELFLLRFRTTLIMGRGILRRLYKKHKWDSFLRCGSKRNKVVPQKLTELTLAYVFLSLGACAAFLVLCVERLTVGAKLRSSLRSRISVVPPRYVP